MDSTILIIIFGVAFLVSSGGALFLWWRYGRPKQRKQTLVDAIAHGALVLTPDNTIEMLNSAAAQLWSTSDHPLIGQPFPAMLKGPWPHSELKAKGEAYFTAVLDNETIQVYNLHITSLAIPRNRPGYLVTITKTQGDESRILYSSAVANQLLKVANAATRTPAIGHTAPAVLKNIIDVTEAEGGSLLILNRQDQVTDGIAMTKGSAKVQVIDGDTASQATKQGFVQEVLNTKEKLISSDITASKRWKQLYSERTPVRSILAVPLLHDSEIQGVIILTHTETNRFGGDQVQFFNASSQLLGQLLRSAKQYEEQVNLTVRQKTIDRILRMVGEPTNPAELAQRIVDAVADRANWMMVAILTPRPDKELLTATALKTRLYMQSNYDLPFDQSVSGRAFTSGKTQITEESQEGTGTIEHPPMMSLICVPLRQGDKKLGVLTIGSDQPEAFSKKEVKLAESIADAVAVTLTNASFHDQVTQYVTNLTSLFEATKRISRLLNIKEILQESLHTAIRFTGFDAGLISLYDQPQHRLILAHQSGMNRFAANLVSEINLSDTISGMVQSRAKYVLLENGQFPSFTRKTIEKNLPEAMQLMRDMGYVAYAGAPLLYQAKALGTLCLFHSSPKNLSEEESSVHLALAQQTAAMVANARLVRDIEGERQRLLTVIRSSHEGIIMVGNEWETLVLNETALALLGIEGEPEIWQERHVRHLLKPLRENFSDIFADLHISQQRAEQYGEKLWRGAMQRQGMFLEWVGVPVQSEDAMLGRLFVLYDVSESHQLQQLREDLVYTMVHDLRNPLGVANMSAQYFRDRFYDQWDDDDREVLDGVEEALAKALRLITGILQISRLEDKSMPIDPSWIEPELFLSQLLIKHDPIARQKDIVLDLIMPDMLPTVWVDFTLFERILQNLLDNAIKFTPAGGQIVVKVTEEPLKNRLLISVSDTGTGIPDGIELFRKFSKGGQEETGSGLGLAYCKMALDAHGQSIWLEKSSPEGTTITFSLDTKPAIGE